MSRKSKKVDVTGAIEGFSTAAYTGRRPLSHVEPCVVSTAAIPLAHGKLRSRLKPYHYLVYLWGDEESYEEAAGAVGEQTRAVCITDSWVDDNGQALVLDKLGEIHFLSGSWDVNTVAHEATHALLQRLRYLAPGPDRVLNEMSPDYDEEDEEVIAYEMGDWVEALLSWLSAQDPASPYPKTLFQR